MSQQQNKVDLKRLFMRLQKQMIDRLQTHKEIPHTTTKGDASELNWIEMLRTYLPIRYAVDKALVLDSDGNLSEQQDVVIYDRQYSALLFDQDDAMFIPAESVYAVFEVKPTINKGHIEYAGRKVQSVRILKRTSAIIPYVEGEYSPKKHFEILGGILALSSDWQPALGKPFEKALSGIDKSERLDLGCVLQAGGFEVHYDDPLGVEKSAEEEALIFFFLRLFARLQSLGTAPAIDVSEYAKVLD